MQMVLGQSRFAPFGLPFLGSEELMEGRQSMTASDDYHIGVDYHKSDSHLVVQDFGRPTPRTRSFEPSTSI